MYDLSKIMFLDIETVPQRAALHELGDELASLWEHKFQATQRQQPDRYGEGTTAEEAFTAAAGIYAEFGKIVCISVGFVYPKDGQMHLRTKSFAHDDERVILQGFARLLDASWNTREHLLCGHNIKEFDIPYICRRMVVHRIPLPSLLDLGGKKPWETPLIDTMELWKFGDKKSYTALKLLTAIFGIPTPKDDIDGSQVAQVYYEEHDLPRIATYCEKDVVATAQVFLRLNQLPGIPPENVEHR